MGQALGPLPHWSGDDLQTALDRLRATGPGHPVRQHLMREMTVEAATGSPAQLLAALLATATLVAQRPSSAIDPRREDRSFG